MEKRMKQALIISLIGILVLLCLSSKMEPDIKSIGDITSKDINSNVKVFCNITRAASYDETDFQILTLKDSTGVISGILNSKTLINKTNNVYITGKIKEYNSSLEMSIDKISLSFSG